MVGLLYLHSHNLAHRNLKPSNVLLSREGNSVLLSDYGGFHRPLYDYLDVEGGAGKNMHYYMNAAPMASVDIEAARKEDVYSLGLCIIALAGGDATERGDEEVHIPEILSKTAKEFISACLKRDPHERPEIATLLKHAFVALPYTPPSLHHSSSTPSFSSHSALIPPVSDPASSSSLSSTPSPGSSQSRSEPVTPLAAPDFNNFANTSPGTTVNSSGTVNSIGTNVTSNGTVNSVGTAETGASSTGESGIGVVVTKNAKASLVKKSNDDDDEYGFSSSSSSVVRVPSRYQQDFEELETIGRGGFGIVVKARNKLDAR